MTCHFWYHFNWSLLLVLIGEFMAAYNIKMLVSGYPSMEKHFIMFPVEFDCGFSISVLRKKQLYKKMDVESSHLQMVQLFWCSTPAILRKTDLRRGMLQTEPPGQNQLCMLNFADNKDWYGGGLSESLTWVPGIAGTQFEMKRKPPARHRNGLTFLIGNRSARPSLLLVSGPTKRHISIAAHQLVWRVTCVRKWIIYDARADGTTQR
jgi:hypothetical protein